MPKTSRNGGRAASPLQLVRPFFYLGFAFLVGVFLVSPAAAASAQNRTSAFADPPKERVEAKANGTRIEIDRKADVIRFFIGGREGMLLDSAGLHVLGNIDYGGALTDYGASGFNAEIKSKHRRGQR